MLFQDFFTLLIDWTEKSSIQLAPNHLFILLLLRPMDLLAKEVCGFPGMS